jgi:hypothetical protein
LQNVPIIKTSFILTIITRIQVVVHGHSILL